MIRTQASVKKEEKRSSEKCEKKEGKDTKKIEGKDEKNDNGSSGQTSESIKKSEEKKRISMLMYLSSQSLSNAFYHFIFTVEGKT